MANTTIQTNNQLIIFRREVSREYIRQNLFSPYVGNEITAIIRVLQDPKNGGQVLNIPLVARLPTPPVGGLSNVISTGTLVGNEQSIDNYGDRMWIDWARMAVVLTKAEEQKSSIDLFGLARPLLEDWGKELQRNEIVDAFYAVPLDTTPPAGLGSTNGQRVNGALFDSATATQRNNWYNQNLDRMLVGGQVGNAGTPGSAVWLTQMGNIQTTMTLSASMLAKAKRQAMAFANPRIRPYKLKNGREYFVCFANSYQFRDLQQDPTIIQANTQARPREGDGLDENPLFQDGDLIYNGVIIRQIPELTIRVPAAYATAGAGGTVPIGAAFLCGQSAMAWAWGRMPKPTFLKQDDYQFLRGVGIEMAYGLKKIAKLQAGTGYYKEWGVFTIWTASVADT